MQRWIVSYPWFDYSSVMCRYNWTYRCKGHESPLEGQEVGTRVLELCREFHPPRHLHQKNSQQVSYRQPHCNTDSPSQPKFNNDDSLVELTADAAFVAEAVATAALPTANGKSTRARGRQSAHWPPTFGT